MDLSKLISGKLLVQANTGSGKSWAIRRILESSSGEIQHIILDTEGEFATLREKFDYVLIGKGYDIAADPKTAALMALRLWEEGVSAIVDLYELTPWERQMFVKNFVDAMVNAPKKLWRPVLLVIDEAHEYAPENDKNETGRSLHLLASKGRKRRIGVIFATQRISSLSKNVVAACKNKLIGQASLDIDIKRSAGELGFTSKDDMRTIRDLEPGEFYAFGPAISKDIIKVKIGPVITSHGDEAIAVGKVAPASNKIKNALAKLADLPQEAEREANTIADYKSQIAVLKTQLRQFPQKNVETDPKAIEKAVSLALENQVKDFERERTEWKKLVKWFDVGLIQFSKIFATSKRPAVNPIEFKKYIYSGDMRVKTGNGIGQDAVMFVPNNFKIIPEHNKPRGILAINPDMISGLEKLPRAEQKIINALAWFESIGLQILEKAAVAFMAGYSVGSGGYNNACGALRSKGLVIYPNGGEIALTDEGRRLAIPPNIPLTQEELHRHVLNILPSAERKILQVLLSKYPEQVDSSELAIEAGYQPSSGGFNNAKGRLRTLALVEYPQAGKVKARPLLFL